MKSLFSILLVICVFVLDGALWLTWFLRLIEVDSIFNHWLIDISSWVILLLAIACSLMLARLMKRADRQVLAGE